MDVQLNCCGCLTLLLVAIPLAVAAGVYAALRAGEQDKQPFRGLRRKMRLQWQPSDRARAASEPATRADRRRTPCVSLAEVAELVRRRAAEHDITPSQPRPRRCCVRRRRYRSSISMRRSSRRPCRAAIRRELGRLGELAARAALDSDETRRLVSTSSSKPRASSGPGRSAVKRTAPPGSGSASRCRRRPDGHADGGQGPV